MKGDLAFNVDYQLKPVDVNSYQWCGEFDRAYWADVCIKNASLNMGELKVLKSKKNRKVETINVFNSSKISMLMKKRML
jgi:hypothetical protein